MKTRFDLLAAAMCLAAANAAFCQSSIQFSATSYTVAESGGTITLAVVRSNDTSIAVSVGYATADGTATAGLKYTATNGTLTFAAGETNEHIVVPILNDGFVDGTKTFQVILSNPTGGAVLGTRTNATVSVTDNDVGVQFALSTYSVTEDAGAVLLGVVRGDDGTLPVTVDLATSDVTAICGLDYAEPTNTLSFAATERGKLVPVPILNDSQKEGANKTFRVTLSNVVGATLGNTKTTTVSIVDNDQGFQFTSASYGVGEDVGAALLRVLRGTDAAESTATVDYAVADVTATNGLDYAATNGTLSFGPGEKVKVLPIAILNDGVKETTKSFLLTLSNPTGGAVLGSVTTTTVSVLDNDPGVGFDVTSCSVWEKAGEINLAVLRGNDGALGPFTIQYATVDGSARVGQDYEERSGALQFAENETLQCLKIPILADDLAESAESFQVTLSNSTGGITLGNTTVTVNIMQNDCTLTPPIDADLGIGLDFGVNVLTWTGGGQLQRADRVTGPWQTVTSATNPWVVHPPIPASFYRVAGPRPVKMYVPSSYDGQTPLPLVILLHGWGWTGQEVENYMQLRASAEARGFLYCYPDALKSSIGTFWNSYFWNGADAAAFRLPNTDDVGFLRGLIQEVGRHFALDRKRVYLIGHSNGSVMAYRMACESADLVASIVGFAGLRLLDFGLCEPSEPVNILHIHGTADARVNYAGSAFTSPAFPFNSAPYPCVMRNLQDWAGYNGASDPITDARPSMDLTSDVPGFDAVVTRYTTSQPGGAVELWTINGAGHVPALAPQFSSRVIDWLLAHPKP